MLTRYALDLDSLFWDFIVIKKKVLSVQNLSSPFFNKKLLGIILNISQIVSCEKFFQ